LEFESTSEALPDLREERGNQGLSAAGLQLLTLHLCTITLSCSRAMSPWFVCSRRNSTCSHGSRLAN
jgi:hypothetical protein